MVEKGKGGDGQLKVPDKLVVHGYGKGYINKTSVVWCVVREVLDITDRPVAHALHPAVQDRVLAQQKKIMIIYDRMFAYVTGNT